MLIVTWHAISPDRSRVTVPRDRLLADLLALKDAGHEFVTLDTVVHDLSEGTGRDRAVCVTFDDGYMSVATDALPVLDALRIPAAVFVIAGRIGQNNRWPGQPPGIPVMPLIDRAALDELAAAGWTIAAHSWSHPVLTTVDDDAAAFETITAADRLEQIVQRPVRHFAYPCGIRGAREIALASSRFDSAVTADCRAVTASSRLDDLPRIDAHDLHVAARLRLLDRPGLEPYLSVRRTVRRWLR